MILNIIFDTEDMCDKEMECKICGAMNPCVDWTTSYSYFDERTEKVRHDMMDETFYHCESCGFFFRECGGDYTGYFNEYFTEGISLMETSKKGYKQIAILRKHLGDVENLKILDYRNYKPNFYK